MKLNKQIHTTEDKFESKMTVSLEVLNMHFAYDLDIKMYVTW